MVEDHLTRLVWLLVSFHLRHCSMPLKNSMHQISRARSGETDKAHTYEASSYQFVENCYLYELRVLLVFPGTIFCRGSSSSQDQIKESSPTISPCRWRRHRRINDGQRETSLQIADHETATAMLFLPAPDWEAEGLVASGGNIYVLVFVLLIWRCTIALM